MGLRVKPGGGNLGEKATNDNLIHQKTRRTDAGERPARYSGAFARGACAYLDTFGSRREPLDTLAETARIPVRIGHAVWLGRSGPSNLPNQHDGNAYAELEGRRPRQLTRDPG